MMSETLDVRIHGYAAARVELDRGTWEKWDRKDRREWARSQLSKRGEATDVAALTVDNGDGDTIAEEEW